MIPWANSLVYPAIPAQYFMLEYLIASFSPSASHRFHNFLEGSSKEMPVLVMRVFLLAVAVMTCGEQHTRELTHTQMLTPRIQR